MTVDRFLSPEKILLNTNLYIARKMRGKRFLCDLWFFFVGFFCVDFLFWTFLGDFFGRFDTSGSMIPRLVPGISPCDGFCRGRAPVGIGCQSVPNAMSPDVLDSCLSNMFDSHPRLFGSDEVILVWLLLLSLITTLASLTLIH